MKTPPTTESPLEGQDDMDCRPGPSAYGDSDGAIPPEIRDMIAVHKGERAAT